MSPPVAITWTLSPLTGWGKVGLSLYERLLARRRPCLLPRQPAWGHFASVAEGLHAAVAAGDAVAKAVERSPDRTVSLDPVTVLHGFGNNLAGDPAMLRVRGSRNVALVAIEDTLVAEGRVRRLAAMDATIVHSSFTAGLMRGWGVTRLAVAFQGVDPAVFHPRPAQGRFGGRFVVFSGGKLEHRKGQDLVVAAFARFRQRHPDSLLVCAWSSFWPELAFGINEGVLPEPLAAGDDGRPDVARWLAANGVPPEAVVLLDTYRPEDIAAVLAECHVAVFPNRCESATNLVAMEAMAAGVPCILSANTGHLDLAAPSRSLVLERQAPVADPAGNRLGWGESDIDEIVAAMESVHRSSVAARALGLAASAFISARSWERFADTVLDIADGTGGGDPVDPAADRTPFDLALDRVAARVERPVAFQVGGFDGVSFDPLRRHLARPAWRGVIAEPMPEPFSRLAALYAGQDRVRPENCAIGPVDGEAVMWRFRPEVVAGGRLHPAYGGMSSFLLPDLLARGGSLQKAAGFDDATMAMLRGLTEPVTVRCRTFASVLAEHGLDRVDVLQIDAEGYDLEILRAFDFARHRPAVVHYEEKHLDAAQEAEAHRLLAAHGYVLQRCGENTLAILPD